MVVFLAVKLYHWVVKLALTAIALVSYSGIRISLAESLIGLRQDGCLDHFSDFTLGSRVHNNIYAMLCK
jgi:hypothetical protein